MKPCRVSCCMSPAIAKKEEEEFPITLLTTRSARWSMQRLGMPAGGSSIVALMVLEHADTHAEELAYHELSSGSAALTFQWSTAASDEVMKVCHNKCLSVSLVSSINAF